MKRAWLCALVLALAATAAHAATGIKDVVKLVEARYHVRHHGVPLLWIAKPFMLGSGAGGLKMATFEHFRVPARDLASLKEDVRRALGPEWSPFIETWSNTDREWTVIYARPSGGKLHMLIVASDRDDFTMMQLRVSGKARDEWVDKPVKKAAHGRPGETRIAAR